MQIRVSCLSSEIIMPLIKNFSLTVDIVIMHWVSFTKSLGTVSTMLLMSSILNITVHYSIIFVLNPIGVKSIENVWIKFVWKAPLKNELLFFINLFFRKCDERFTILILGIFL